VLDRRIKIKNLLLAAKMLNEDRPVDEVRLKHAVKLLKAAGIPVPATHMFTLSEINAELDKTTLDSGSRVALKQHCLAAGLLDASDGNMMPPPAPPNTKMAYLILDQLGLDYPLPGHKLSRGALNAALSKAGLSPIKRIEIKSTLAMSGVID
jgi:hypothetical protein